jgi:hypothetical protein
VLSWGCRRGRSFDLALVLELLAFVTLPTSGVDRAGECPDQLGKTLVPQYLYSWGKVKIFVEVKIQSDALRRWNPGKLGLREYETV